MHVNMRADHVRKRRGHMGWDTTRWYQIFSVMYLQTSFCHDRISWKKSLTWWNVLGWLNIPLYLWMILILITFWIRLHLLIESTVLKLHMICTSWLTNQHEWMIKPPLFWMSFLRPIQHFIARVQFSDIHWVTTILFTPIWNLKILNHQWLITTLWNFVTWKISRVSPMI